MITPPDETYSTAQAASFLDMSERQCARNLKAGIIKAQRPNGRWRVTALALWQYLGIDREMMQLWLDYCSQARSTGNLSGANAADVGPETMPPGKSAA